MVQIHDSIKKCISLANDLKKVSLPDLVKATSGFEIYPLDLDNREQKQVFETIKNAASNFIRQAERSHARYQGNRANDVGKRIEEVFVEELKKTDLTPQLLGASGYPDVRIETTTGEIYFLESKAVSSDVTTTFRSFYYSTGKKIDTNGHHLLIAWIISEESPKYWRVNSWKLIDLFYLQLSTKLEFNASNRELYQPGLTLAEG